MMERMKRQWQENRITSTRTVLTGSMTMLALLLVLGACGGLGESSGRIYAPTATSAAQTAAETQTAVAQEGQQMQTSMAIRPIRAENVPSDVEVVEPQQTAMSEVASATMEVLDETPYVEPTPPAELIAMNFIAEDPQAYEEKYVTVQGTVAEVIGDYSFRLQSPDNKDSLLVIAADEDVATMEGDAIMVGGVVFLFDLVAIEDETGLDLIDDLFVEFTDQPVIIADSFDEAPST